VLSGWRRRQGRCDGDRGQSAGRVQKGPRFCRLARPCATPELQRRQADAWAHHQGGQPIFVEAACAFGNRAASWPGQTHRRFARLDRRAPGPQAGASCNGGARQQAGKDRLCDAEDRRRIPQGNICESLRSRSLASAPWRGALRERLPGPAPFRSERRGPSKGIAGSSLASARTGDERQRPPPKTRKTRRSD
jgi:hypothetical protein